MNLIEAAQKAKTREEADKLAARRAFYDKNDAAMRRVIAANFSNWIGQPDLVKPGDLTPGSYSDRDGGFVPSLYDIVIGGIHFRLSKDATAFTVRARTKKGLAGGTGAYADWVVLSRLSDLVTWADRLAYATPQPATHGGKV